jgi:putative phosphoesterase
VTRAVVLSDTHVRAGSDRRLPESVYDALAGSDLILHAGDVVSQQLIDELQRFAPVHAVLGNNDFGLAGVLPETRVVDVAGVRVGMVHDSGARAGRAQRLRRRFPEADVVVFGHSHLPVNETGVDGQLLFNPGSPTERRMAPTRTFGVLEADGGRIVRAEIVDV